MNNLTAPIERKTSPQGKDLGWGFGEYYNYPTREEAETAQSRLREVVETALKGPKNDETQEQYTLRMIKQFPFTA